MQTLMKDLHLSMILRRIRSSLTMIRTRSCRAPSSYLFTSGDVSCHLFSYLFILNCIIHSSFILLHQYTRDSTVPCQPSTNILKNTVSKKRAAVPLAAIRPPKKRFMPASSQPDLPPRVTRSASRQLVQGAGHHGHELCTPALDIMHEQDEQSYVDGFIEERTL